MKSLRNNRLVKNAGWIMVGQALGYGLRLAYFVLLARLLGAVQYGVVVGAFALVNLVAPYCQLGMGTLLLRYVSADPRQFRVMWGNVLLVTFATSGIIIVGLQFIAQHVIGPGSAAVVIFTAVSMCLCEQVTVCSTQVFQAFQEMRMTAFLNQLTSLLRTVTALAMLIAFHQATAWQWCVGMTISSAVAALIALCAVTIRFGWPQIRPATVLQHSREGLEYAFGTSTQSAYNDLDKAMLSHYGMDAANGIYTMAYRIIDMASVPILSIQFAAEPQLFQLSSHSVDDAVALGRKLLKRVLLVSAGVAVILFVFAPLIPLVVGKGFREGTQALRWLCLIPVFRSIHGIAGSVLTCTGRQRYRTVTQLAAVALNFVLNLILIPTFSWLGAAYASLLTDGALALMNWSLLEKLVSDSGQLKAWPMPGRKLPTYPLASGPRISGKR